MPQLPIVQGAATVKPEQQGLIAPVATARSKESTLSLPEARRNNPPWFRFLLTVFLFILPAISARGQTVTATLTAGTSPFAVAVNPVNNKIYVANTGSGSVTVNRWGQQYRQHGGCRERPHCRGGEPGDQQDLCGQPGRQR